ncbi:patatin family protein [Aquibacillus sp. 3ASR75-11]|uniref:Patatin family protein n=1 Tax=Terrihalobacillus insolitus TaxID=2950438 RepID=A0A9X4AMR7_9BACI|nr:patatin family protein [Terrihalobacillus insolitus]MDC3412750.1 patatin family protein [Terrihalobacillus insolitus]MDC3423773.1 patatin family protein [Terrihalobacillus insolitus]
MEKTGLILEGGGMRGAYTAGVLDFFLDNNITFPYVVGSSAGACVGSSYVAKQRERNYKIIVEYGDHPEYISFTRAIRKRELFGMDFLFDILPNSLVPFDYASFSESNTKFVVGTTDIYSGQSVYYHHFSSKEELLRVIRASSSLPFLAPSIHYKGKNLMDGGIADPIAIQPSIEAGNKKHVVVLTRNEGYIKKRAKFNWVVKNAYKKHPGLKKAISKRHQLYNHTMTKLEAMEKVGEAFLIRPKEPLLVSRVEKNKQKLHALYEQGYFEAKQQKENIQAFLEGESSQLL